MLCARSFYASLLLVTCRPATSQPLRQDFLKRKYELLEFCEPFDSSEGGIEGRLLDAVRGPSLAATLALLVRMPCANRAAVRDPISNASLLQLARSCDSELQELLLRLNGVSDS
eukprot:m.184753 g.184753  ORF g.184753 m.184753 type:complete len:114 (+) comp53529_c0_seq1:1588-1929(+)